MSAPAPSKLNPDLQAVLALAGLAPSALASLAGCSDTAAAMERLRTEDGGQAARLGAFALPNREAVWWALMCAQHTAPPEQRGVDAQAAGMAEQWVRRGDDSSRRQAMDLARRAGFDTVEAWAAVAAFWSGDSMAPPDQPTVPPGPSLVGSAVAGAVALAAVRGDPARRTARLRRFLASLDEIAAGAPGRIGAETTEG